MQKIIIWLIEFYQKTFSPDTGAIKGMYVSSGCKYVPSCSQYMKQAVIKKGPLKGLIMGFWRILRCNPFSKGGVDEVK